MVNKFKSGGKKPWYFTVYYTGKDGKRKRKKKEGFATKHEAQEAEKIFLAKAEGILLPSMTVADLSEEYLSSCVCRKELKQSTMITKRNISDKYIIPFFGDMLVSEITKNDVAEWQDYVKSNNLSQTYLHTVHSQLSAMFNYAIREYELPSNPARQCGSMGEKKTDEMLFWRIDEFKQFINVVNDPMFKVIFYILFYSGIREGELLALKKEDFDFDNSKMTIDETYSRVNKEDVFTPPKTRRSKRKIDMTTEVMEMVKAYMAMIYGLSDEDRIFPIEKSRLTDEKDRYCKKAGVKRIRIHDFRHSHAAMLIHLGVRIELISARLGHEKVSTTQDIYGHLYPDDQKEIASNLSQFI